MNSERRWTLEDSLCQSEEEANRLFKLFDGPSIVLIDGDPVSQERFEKVYSRAEMHKNATAQPSHACSRCSKLASILSQMASNPPGMEGIETPRGLLGNAHIDYGWLAAVRMLKDKMEQEG